ncbi:MAG: hypothetical protein ACKVJG_24420 [Candidatus Latescibacterota bacterium]|jgi:hypothetical protein|tara:strand:+ start:79 stop:882 length:804 start_codon:yes stop_codon:yes gene_type:complete
MTSMVHPVVDTDLSDITLPAVRYVGRCPQTKGERALRPTAEVIAHAEVLKDYLTARRTADTGFSTRNLYEEKNGKMFGVMLCRDARGQLGTLRAFSGEWEDRWHPPGWVPSSGNLCEYSAEREETEAQVALLTQHIEELKNLPSTKSIRRKIEQTKNERGNLSRTLTDHMHDAYRFENFLGEIMPLKEVETGGPRPPTGMGDCCAPKLLQYAARHRLDPLGMVEFWWGASSQMHPRIEGTYYSSCEHKCYPILGFMLRGAQAAEVST